MAEGMEIFGQGHIYMARDWQSTSQWDENKIIPKDLPQNSKSRCKTDIPQETVQKGQGGAPQGQLLLLVVGAPTDGAQV